MKKRIWLLLSLCLTAGVTAATVVYAVSADSEESAIEGFLNAWQEQRYAAMYEMVSSDVLQTMTEEQFVKRYESVYEGIEAQNVEAHLVSTEDHDSFKFHIKMMTLAGPIEFDQVGHTIKEDRHWKIQWEPSFLFPDLHTGEKVSAEVLKADRGEIVDRQGRGLAINEEQFAIGLVPKDLQAGTIQSVARLLNMEPQEVESKLNASWVKPDMFVPVTVLPKTDLLVRQLVALPGVVTQPKTVRAYPLQEAAAHLIGYTGSLSAQEYEQKKASGYQLDDEIGKAGMEKLLEGRLHGRDGGRITILGADGAEKAVVAERKPEPGETVKLTLDAKLQEKMYEQLRHEVGAGVAIHPLTGEVLGLVSTPAYDPNEMAHGVSETQWKSWTNDPSQPFLNRFASAYPPGSAFKPLTAAMALDTKAITPEETHDIVGKKWQKDAAWGGYYVTRVSDTYQKVDLQKALITSDNIYFAEAALAMGSQSFVSEASKFGFGEPLPLSYPFDESTLSQQGIQKEILLADSGYGQGEVLMTPLHVALTYTAFANGGNMLEPQLVMSNSTPKVWKEHVMQPSVAKLVEGDMVQVIESPMGTGHGAQIVGLKLAGKTGTAELKETQDTQGKEFGWFVAYNTDNPQLLVALMVENVQGRGGSHMLAPKVQTLFQTLPH